MNPESPTLIYGIGPQVLDYATKSSELLAHEVGQNTGNIVFTNAIVSHLRNIESLSWDHRLDATNTNPLCIIPSANFVGSHTDMNFLYEQMKAFNGRILSIGLGAQASSEDEELLIPEGTKKWLHFIADRSTDSIPNIAVRGAYTLKVLESIGLGETSVIVGCPSNFISPDPRLGQSIAGKLNNLFERVAVCSAHYRWNYLAKSEQDLYRLATGSGGIYINQSPALMIALGLQDPASMNTEEIPDLIGMTCPDLDRAEFQKHVKRYYRSYFSVSEWMAAVKRCSLVVGARIHGVMVALQAGVPGLCIAHDARTKELCEVMLIPYLSREEVSNGISKDQIEARVRCDWSLYDAKRRDLLMTYVKFLERNNASVSSHLLQLHDSIAS